MESGATSPPWGWPLFPYPPSQFLTSSWCGSKNDWVPSCPSQARTYSIFGHTCTKFGSWPGRGPKTLSPAGHHTVTTGTSAELGSAGFGPLLRGARLAPGRPPQEEPHSGSLCLRESRASAACPRSPAVGVPPARPESERPNRETQTDPARGSPSRWCPLTTTHAAHRIGSVQIRTRRRRRRVHCPEATTFLGETCSLTPSPSPLSSAELAPQAQSGHVAPR